MLEAVTLFAANFMFIALKAWQQRNVAFLQYGMVFIVSQMLAAVEVYVIWRVAHLGANLETIIPVGLGGGLGAVSAMYLTRGLNKK